MPRVFISHSSHDRELAGLLLDLLRSAINLPDESVRCTSVEGHKLAGGQETDRRLREEIRSCEAFIGLISEASIESAYVLFELGARWGTEKHLLPLLAPGANPSLLRGPLAGINALRFSSAADLHQMIQEIGNLLALPPAGPAVYQRRIDEILRAVARATTPTVPLAVLVEDATRSQDVSLLTSNNDSADAETVIRKHCEKEWPSDFSMRAYCIEQQQKALTELRRGRPADIPENIFELIRSKCAKEWPDDFGMRQYCEEEQIRSYRKLQEG